MKFEKIKPGMTLYDVHSYRMGNTTLKTMGCWTVRVISVDTEKRTAVVSWNGNRETTYYENALTKLKESKPIMVRNIMGSYRLQTAEEKKAAKLAEMAKQTN